MITEAEQEEMRRLFDVGLKAANNTLKVFPGTVALDPLAPGTAALFSGIAAMIVESKRERVSVPPGQAPSEGGFKP